MGCGISHVAEDQILHAPRARQIIPTTRPPNPAARDREYFQGIRDRLQEAVDMEMSQIQEQRQRESRAQRRFERIQDIIDNPGRRFEAEDVLELMQRLYFGADGKLISVEVFDKVMLLLRSRNPELERVDLPISEDGVLQRFVSPPDSTDDDNNKNNQSPEPQGQANQSSEYTTVWATVKAWLDNPTGAPPTVDCIICMKQLAITGLPNPEMSEEETEKPAFLPCGHIVGEDCIRQVLRHDDLDAKCPLCRHPLLVNRLAAMVSACEGEIHRVFGLQQWVHSLHQ